MKGVKLIYALTGSFCNFEKSFVALEKMVKEGAEVIAAMSFNVAQLDTRYGTAQEIREKLMAITRHEVIDSIVAAEPIGPQKMADVFVIAPCTGNTLAKLANGVIDTPVLMGAKSHLRGGNPVVIALSTNDALSGGAQNLGRLLNVRNVYFVPMEQDNYIQKPSSLSADYNQIEATIESALRGKQLEPVLFN